MKFGDADGVSSTYIGTAAQQDLTDVGVVIYYQFSIFTKLCTYKLHKPSQKHSLTYLFKRERETSAVEISCS